MQAKLQGLVQWAGRYTLVWVRARQLASAVMWHGLLAAMPCSRPKTAGLWSDERCGTVQCHVIDDTVEFLSNCRLFSPSQHGPHVHRLSQHRFRLHGTGQYSHLRRSRPARPSWRLARVAKFSSQVRCCCSTSSTAGATMADRCCTHTTPSGRSLQTASCRHRAATLIVFRWCCTQEALHRPAEEWLCKRPAPGQGQPCVYTSTTATRDQGWIKLERGVGAHHSYD